MNFPRVFSVLLVLVGLVNFAPLLGLLGAERLASLYGIGLLEGDLLILMRHRALLFGIVGGFIIYSAFKPGLQAAALVMAGVSMLGYLALVYTAVEPGEALLRVATIDLFACIPLVLAAVLYVRR